MNTDESFEIPSLIAWKLAVGKPMRGNYSTANHIVRIFDGAIPLKGKEGFRKPEYVGLQPFFELYALPNGDHKVVVKDMDGLLEAARELGFHKRRHHDSLRLVLESTRDLKIDLNDPVIETKHEHLVTNTTPAPSASLDIDPGSELSEVDGLVELLACPGVISIDDPVIQTSARLSAMRICNTPTVRRIELREASRTVLGIDFQRLIFPDFT